MADTVKSGITNSPFVGVTNFHVAKLTADTSGGTPIYEASVSIPWVRQVQIKPKNNSATLYADNMSVATSNVMSEYELTIETATMPLEYKALLLGHKIDAGKLTVGKEDVAPYFAVMFESTKQNGKKRFVRFAKVQFSEPDETSKTKEESIQYNTPSMTATAIYRTADGVSLEQADEEAEGYVDTTGTNWYTLTTV